MKKKEEVEDRPCQCHLKFIIIFNEIIIKKKKNISSLPTFHPLQKKKKKKKIGRQRCTLSLPPKFGFSCPIK